jgi:hypothetical protein
VTALLAAAPWALVGVCFQVELATEPGLPESWRHAAEQLATELAGDAAARCAPVSLRIQPLGSDAHQEAVLEIETADGRRARRRVAAPSELGAVVFGVLASIPTEPSDPSDEQPLAPPARPAPPPEPIAWPVASPRRQVTSPLMSPAFVGMTFGTRIGFPTRNIAPELDFRADARLPRWLVSFSGRASLAGTRLNGTDDTMPEESEYSVGALVGPWFALGGGVLSFGAGPRLGAVTEATDTKRRTRGDLWLELAGRYVFSAGERWHPTVAFEVDAAPRRMLAAAETAGLPFPSWSAGIRFGIVGGLP